MTDGRNLRVSYDIGCMRSLKKLPPKASMGFLDMMAKVMSDPSRNGLNIEPVEGSKDKGIKSVRIDRGYRAIGFLSGQDLLFLHVNEHDKAYRWASNRSVRIDLKTNRIRVVEEVPVEVSSISPEPIKIGLFHSHKDKELVSYGIMPEEINLIRTISDEAGLEARQDDLDATTCEILFALAAGYGNDAIRELLGTNTDEDKNDALVEDLSFGEAIDTVESRQTIFIPESEGELRKFLEGDLEGWRVFLHPEQRRFAYRNYNGPAMIRGGAGTGKTVVAMHRAKHLADLISKDPSKKGKRVLVTTFTKNLALDIEANLNTLCPEHLESASPRIEVINLDAWVSTFLKRRNFDRKVAYFSDEMKRIDELWAEVFDQRGCPEGLSEEFVRAEWAQIIQAKGIDNQKAYLKISRVGRGTPLDRKKRSVLWVIFEDYRARLLDEGLAEPDDAYREAVTLLKKETSSLPYVSVIVDEAQDMGEQAFRLVRAIIPLTGSGDKNSLFIVGDAHQRIYARKASMSSCGINIRGRTRKLRLNYRTTDDIRRWAVSVLEGIAIDDLDDGLDTLKGYTSLYIGDSPTLSRHQNLQDEINSLMEWVQSIIAIGTHDTEIGILARTNRQVGQVTNALKAINLPYVQLGNDTADDLKIPGVRVTTMHRAKGLEFHAVAIPFLSEGTFPPKPVLASAVDSADKREIIEREKSLLHVAATRAKKSLRISWNGEPSDILPKVND